MYVTPAHVAEIESVKSQLSADAFKVLQAIVRLTVPSMTAVLLGKMPRGEESFDVVRFRDELERISDEGSGMPFS